MSSESVKKGENGCVKYSGERGGSWLCIFRGRGEETPHTPLDLLPHAFLPLYSLTYVHVVIAPTIPLLWGCFSLSKFTLRRAQQKQHLFNFAAFASVGGWIGPTGVSTSALLTLQVIQHLLESTSVGYISLWRIRTSCMYVAVMAHCNICNTFTPPVRPKCSSIYVAAYASLPACCYIPFQWQVTPGSCW